MAIGTVSVFIHLLYLTLKSINFSAYPVYMASVSHFFYNIMSSIIINMSCIHGLYLYHCVIISVKFVLMIY
jgi:hypothetical protein